MINLAFVGSCISLGRGVRGLCDSSPAEDDTAMNVYFGWPHRRGIQGADLQARGVEDHAARPGHPGSLLWAKGGPRRRQQLGGRSEQVATER